MAAAEVSAALRPKQQHPRWQIPATRPVRVDLGPAGAGNLIEISAGGMRVRLLAPMRRGAEIPVRIQIPDRPDVVRCYGIVVWSSHTSGATGVRFVRLPDSDKQLLGTWLVELEKAAKAPEGGTVSFSSAAVSSRPLAPLPAPVAAPLQPPIPPPPTTPKVEVLPLAAAPINDTSKPSVVTSGTVEMPKPMVASQTVEMSKPAIAVRTAEIPKPVVAAPTPLPAKPVVAAEKPIVFVAPVRPVVAEPAKVTVAQAAKPIVDEPAKPLAVEPIAAPIRETTAAFARPEPAAHSGVTAMPAKPGSVKNAAAAAGPKPKANFVLELPEHEGFDPTGKIALPPRIDEDAETYKEYPSKRKWLVAAPVAAALIAVPFWFVRQHKAVEPTVVAAASAPAPAPAVETKQSIVTSPVSAPPAPVAKPVITKPTAEVLTPTREVAAEKKTAAPVKIVPAAEPAPIVLAAATSSPIKRTADTDGPAVAPSVAVSAVSPSAVALPANAAVPRLQAPTAPTVSGGALLKRVAPAYPANARSMHLEGTVELVLKVKADGSIGNVRTTKGNPLLATAATDAVKQWKYEPLRMNGVPTETEKTVELKFVLPR